MARWDIAEWVGPTGNRNAGGMTENRGLVIHIMQGSYAGSIAWGKNPASDVSFHFATRGDGHIGQLVDTVDAAWTQGAGNGHWLSVENEGFSGNMLTAPQVEACARLYARGVRDHAWPYQLADSPSGRGLGWHGMGGAAWGGHPDCPGAPIVAQRGAILARAKQINGGGADDMALYLVSALGDPAVWLSDGMSRRGVHNADEIQGWLNLGARRFENVDLSWYGEPEGSAPVEVVVDASQVAAALVADPAFRAAVRAELDATKLAGA